MEMIEDEYDQMITWTWTPPLLPPTVEVPPPVEPPTRSPYRCNVGGGLREAVVAYLAENGPATSSEVADELVAQDPYRWQRATIRKALPTLAYFGIIARVGIQDRHRLYDVRCS